MTRADDFSLAGVAEAEATGSHKISASGYDVTPLTEEEKKADAAKLTEFQR
jgi:hypothetical protein